MSIIVILARIVHIFSAVLWMGGFAAYMIHIQPAANKTMPASGSFFLSFIKTFAPFMVVVASLTVLGGATLYWIDSAGLRLGWITTPSGLGFTFGGLCGLSAWIMGVFVVKPRVDRLTLLSSQVAARNKPPTPEEGAEMGKLSGALVTLGRATLTLLMLALLGMATARYL